MAIISHHAFRPLPASRTADDSPFHHVRTISRVYALSMNAGMAFMNRDFSRIMPHHTSDFSRIIPALLLLPYVHSYPLSPSPPCPLTCTSSPWHCITFSQILVASYGDNEQRAANQKPRANRAISAQVHSEFKQRKGADPSVQVIKAYLENLTMNKTGAQSDSRSGIDWTYLLLANQLMSSLFSCGEQPDISLRNPG